MLCCLLLNLLMPWGKMQKSPLALLGWNLFVLSFHMGMDQYPLIPFLGGWTSIYQLFWCSLGTRVLTHPHIRSQQVAFEPIKIRALFDPEIFRPKSPRMTLAGFKLRSYLFPRKLACNWQWAEKRISNVLLCTLQPPTGNKSLGWLWCRTLPDLNLTKQTGNGTTLHHVTVSVVLAGFHQARGRPACLPQKQVVMSRPS